MAVAYNRYQGNSGRVMRVEERQHMPERQENAHHPSPVHGAKPGADRNQQASPLGSLLQNSLGALETEDILLMLILYLMYRESGDSELLLIMGAMFLG